LRAALHAHVPLPLRLGSVVLAVVRVLGSLVGVAGSGRSFGSLVVVVLVAVGVVVLVVVGVGVVWVWVGVVGRFGVVRLVLLN